MLHSNICLILKINFLSSKVKWNVSISDVRRLKGYLVSYTQVEEYFLIDQNEASLTNDGMVNWNYIYAEYDNDEQKAAFQVKIDVDPFTKYAIYVKAELTLDSHAEVKQTFHFTTSLDRFISKIYYVYSLPARKILERI